MNRFREVYAEANALAESYNVMYKQGKQPDDIVVEFTALTMLIAKLG
jgi:hypothetical protein